MSPGFQAQDFQHLVFPSKMLIDYVRIYQRDGHENWGCDPSDHPTAQYIQECAPSARLGPCVSNLYILVTSMRTQIPTGQRGMRLATHSLEIRNMTVAKSAIRVSVVHAPFTTSRSQVLRYHWNLLVPRVCQQQSATTASSSSRLHYWYRLTANRELPNNVRGSVVTNWNTLYLSASSAPPAPAPPSPHFLYSLTVTVTDVYLILQHRPHVIIFPSLTLLSVSPAPRVYRLNDLLTRLHFSIDRHTVVTILDICIQTGRWQSEFEDGVWALHVRIRL